MDNKFENRDFEHFLKQNADQYRMFPSEKVWKGINNTLHVRRRWYGVGLALLLLTTAAVTGIMLNPSSNKQQQVATNSKTLTKNDMQQSNTQDIVIAPVKPVKTNNKATYSPDNTQKNLFAEKTTKKETATSTEISVDNFSIILKEENNNIEESVIPSFTKLNTVERPVISEQKQILTKPSKSIAKKNIPVIVINNNPVETEIPNVKTDEEDLVLSENISNEKKDIYPMTIESVINSYQYIKPAKKIVWQIYFTPSITYRKLDDNEVFLASARSTIGTAGSYSFQDVNSVVTHKPDVGLQVGFNAGYPLSKIIKVKAGLQINVSKYNIRASSHTSEIATIALNTSGGGTNSVSAVTNYRNVGGYKADWLHNKYISASLPVGAEIKLSGNKKTIIGIGATVEPTYVLGNRAYLLSTDLKNYAEVPSLTRKWNINTGFELFAEYNTGKLDWRIGPQVRYQVFSSFYDKYPIKEHLFDFGIKLGLTLK